MRSNGTDATMLVLYLIACARSGSALRRKCAAKIDLLTSAPQPRTASCMRRIRCCSYKVARGVPMLYSFLASRAQDSLGRPGTRLHFSEFLHAH